MGIDLFAQKATPKGRDLFAVQPTEAIENVSNGSIDSDGADNVGAGVGQVDSSTFDKIDQAFQKIPGVPALAEFAAGANRSVAGFLDFLGPDNVNAALELAGFDERVPTLTEAITAPPASFVEPGLKQQALATAGEIVPSAVAIGQTLRTLAQKLPQLAAGESAGTGVLRQAGATTAKQDIAAGAVAGAGQEVGREVSGETGALVGGVLAPVALGAIPLKAAKNAASSLLKKVTTSKDELKTVASGIYKSLDESGVSVSVKSFDDLADDIASTLKKQGSAKGLTDKAIAFTRELESKKGSIKTLSELDTIRKQAGIAAQSKESADARLGTLAVNKIDDYLDNLSIGPEFRAARDLWHRVKKTETLEQAVELAKAGGSGFENGIRNEFRRIRKGIISGKTKGYSKEELAAISKVVEGTKAGNIARYFGKFGIMDGLTSRSLTTLGGTGLAGGIGTAIGGPVAGTVAASVVPLFGQVSGSLAQRMTLNNARMAQNIIKAGKNGAKITSIYIKNTPEKSRSATELAELFIKNKVPLENVNIRTAKPLISDAAIIASIAKLNDEKEGDK